MSQYDKTVKRILARPFKKDITFQEADKVLRQLGFTCAKKSGSSHQVYRNPKYSKHISIPAVEYIKTYSIEDICDALKFLKEDGKNV
jgi:predicted RNA binding protein YcfA (HicA-like mRNA interferase family)